MDHPSLSDACASPFASYCMQCGRELRHIEIGLHKKMIHRGATQYLCLTCLSAYIQVSEEALLEKAEEFKRQGCMLF